MRKSHDLVRQAVRRWKEFVPAKGGSTAIIFALSSLTLFSAAGVGIDMARAMNVKSRLSGALDAAALAVGTTNGLTTPQLQTLAQQYFDANYPPTTLGTHTPVTVAVSGQSITLGVTGAVPTTLLQIAGISTVDMAVTNQVTKAVTKLRVALVLDNTGSMAQTDVTGTSKISALKTATHQLLTQLQGAAVNPGDVQVSIVPFSLDVNYGTSSSAASWIDWTDFDAAPPSSKPSSSYGPPPQAKSSACPYSTGTSPFGYSCLYLSSGKIAADGKIYPGTDNGNYNPGRGGHHYNGYWDSVKKVATCTSSCTYNHTWHTYNHTAKADLPLHGAWTGCFMDRAKNYDTTNGTPVAGTTATMFPAEINDYCPPVTLNGLSYDWSALSSKVDTMTPNGSTNQTIGLAWGWQALTTGAPLNAASTTDPTIQNVIVLLSDGLNTQDRYAGNGSDQSSAVDARMALACSNAKAAGIKIYTVLVMSGDSSVLSSCATDSKKYFSLSTAGQIVTAFNTIGTELANLHLSK